MPEPRGNGERARLAMWKPEQEWPGLPGVEWAALRTLSAVLDAGLSPVRVAVRPRVIDAEPDEDGIVAERLGLGLEDHAPLYSVLCLQLANHIAANATVRVCKNKPCKRLFVRKLSREQRNRHRVRGVLDYCSDACANAQQQRDHRRRLEKNGSADQG